MKATSHHPCRVLLIFVLLLAVMIPIQHSQAQTIAQGLSINLSVEPSSLTAPGPVEVSVNVANAGSQDFNSQITLMDPDGKPVTSFGDGGSLMRLAAGESYPWKGSYSVSQAQLDEGKLTFSLQYYIQGPTGDQVLQTLPATATLSYIGEKVELWYNRTITPEVVRRGKEVSVIYELVNRGNVKLTKIQVKEHNLISNTAQTIDTLAPGESKTLTFKRSNVTGNLTSSGLITYYKEGDRRQQPRIISEQVSIPLAQPRLSYSLSADKTQVNIGETVTLKLEIKNAGNITYSNVTVTDPKLSEVFSNVQIAAGQTVELTREVTITQTTTFAFTLQLEDNTGTVQSEKVQELQVSAYAEGQMLRLNLTLTADQDSISSLPGELRFHLTVTNDSNSAARNIRIRHANVDVYTIPELAPGQSTVVTRNYSLSQAGKYQFSAIATDSQNNAVTFNSNAMNIAYVAPTPVPTTEVIATVKPPVTHSPLPATDTGTGNQGKNVLFIVMIGVGLLFGLALVLLLISALARMKARAKSNAAYDTFEVSPTRDYTSPPDEGKQALETLRDEEAVEAATAEDLKHRPNIEMPHEKYLRPNEDSKPQGDAPAQALADLAPESQASPQAADEDGSFRMLRKDGLEPPTESESPPQPEQEQGRSRRSRRNEG